ncbi:hypothetical protein HYS95_02000 [Candidatus Daviesbacteria bacterium]|nr:hypothetical protein [Candidatus Daviesbacteria bacterium]
MNNKKFLIISLIILAAVILFFVTGRKNTQLVNPSLQQETVKQSSSEPSVPLYNPPQEIKYDSSTDLKKELDTVNPQILDSDFE